MEQSNYERAVNPCETCTHANNNKPNKATDFSGIMLFVACCVILLLCYKLHNYKNCVYVDDQNNLHVVRDYKDTNCGNTYDTDKVSSILNAMDDLDIN